MRRLESASPVNADVSETACFRQLLCTCGPLSNTMRRSHPRNGALSCQLSSFFSYKSLLLDVSALSIGYAKTGLKTTDLMETARHKVRRPSSTPGPPLQSCPVRSLTIGTTFSVCSTVTSDGGCAQGGSAAGAGLGQCHRCPRQLQGQALQEGLLPARDLPG